MIPVTELISLDDDEVVYRATRAGGPGGQKVNKTSSAIELRFDVRNSPSLPDDVKARLERIAGSRMTLDGELIIFAESHRSQFVNRQEALERLLDMIRRATVRPKPRKATKPTYASKLRRLEGKAKRSSVKSMRSKPPPE